ncbi:putative Pre-mRNA-processing factor 6 [Paratrimastix pyriformis]|uniref:Pre-mRNA-processing factor 6 n=1 Tax=Paratrimastix pyriformis TaxID=342808 RepID=A0ABQ8U8E7_9EUKA|nr:putative Pre-mRNA-processing factor 6 [Paratrimastix pyriformis]
MNLPASYFKQAPSSGYVAGLGRGLAFAQRVPTDTDFGAAPAGYVPGVGRGAKSIEQGVKPTAQPPGGRGRGRSEGPSGAGESDDRGDYSESNYDEFAGYGGSLFNNVPYDAEDREADAIYASVDDNMDARRKRRREEKAKEQSEKYRQAQPKISQMYTPVPDEIIAGARLEAQPVGYIDPSAGLATPMPGMATPVITNLSAMKDAKEQVLSLRLDKVGDSVTGRTNVDPVGYMTSLKSMKIRTEGDMADLEKARALFTSVVNTQPDHAPGWVALARLEEVAGRSSVARRVIAQGCKACPENEDVWIEHARLQTPENARIVLADAVKNLPTSLKIWLAAANLETDPKAKGRPKGRVYHRKSGLTLTCMAPTLTL